MSKLIRLWDRSRVTTDEKCARMRFWNYEYKRRGVVKDTTSLELFTGIVVHDSLAGIALGKDLEAICKAAYEQMYRVLMEAAGGVPDSAGEAYVLEQCNLIEGMIRGFAKHAWPRLLAEYPKILHVEEENEYRTTEPSTCGNCDGRGYEDNGEGLVSTQCTACKGTGKTDDTETEESGAHLGSKPSLLFMAKPDLIAEGENGIAYIEYKTTAWKKESWITSWDTAVQLHSSIKAVKASHGVDVDHVIVQGLYKGYESYGKQTSPFCYAYKRSGNPPFTKDQLSYEYVQGWRKYPVWELDGGLKAWVEGMPENVLADQYPRTAPIFINQELVDTFFRQKEIREHKIAHGMDMLEKYEDDPEMVQYVMDETFPQTFAQCQPSIGAPCPYRRLCFGPPTDPLKEGYVWREAHHVRETEQFKNEEDEPKP